MGNSYSILTLTEPMNVGAKNINTGFNMNGDVSKIFWAKVTVKLPLCSINHRGAEILSLSAGWSLSPRGKSPYYATARRLRCPATDLNVIAKRTSLSCERINPHSLVDLLTCV
jgi:hypothetical protein